ncbi:MAG: hypothetical protein GTO24_00855 [candidate division Zixibacteria bacterium]|nr:hypothetical protein [candidate division Zixibacteria bacterium]
MTGLVADLGGQPNLTEAQRLLLANIRSKLIVLLQIGKYVERQDSIINTEGELIPCLGRNYTAFAEAIRRDLLALGQLGNRTGDKIPTIAEIIAGGKE